MLAGPEAALVVGVDAPAALLAARHRRRADRVPRDRRGVEGHQAARQVAQPARCSTCCCRRPAPSLGVGRGAGRAAPLTMSPARSARRRWSAGNVRRRCRSPPCWRPTGRRRSTRRRRAASGGREPSSRGQTLRNMVDAIVRSRRAPDMLFAGRQSLLSAMSESACLLRTCHFAQTAAAAPRERGARDLGPTRRGSQDAELLRAGLRAGRRGCAPAAGRPRTASSRSRGRRCAGPSSGRSAGHGGDEHERRHLAGGQVARRRRRIDRPLQALEQHLAQHQRRLTLLDQLPRAT